MVASGLLMYYFVRFFYLIINKVAVCIVQMQRPGVHPPFLKKKPKVVGF